MKAKSVMIVFISIFLVSLGCDKSPVEPNDDKFWEKIGPEDATIICLAKDQNGYIYAGTSSNGIFRSVDNGNTWEEINNELPVLMPNTSIRDIEVNTNNVVFAAINDYGVYRFNANNMIWTQVNNGLPEDFWSEDISINDLFPSATNILYAGTDQDGVYVCYDNNGENWEPFNNGYQAYVARVFRRGYSSNIFFKNYGSIYVYSWYPEEKWVKTEMADMENYISGLIANNTVYFTRASNEIFRSADGIHDWESLGEVIETGHIRTIWAAPNNDVFAGMQSSYDSEGGILRSTDNGDTWELLDNNGLPSVITSFIFNTEGHLLAGTSEGVYRTTEPLE